MESDPKGGGDQKQSQTDTSEKFRERYANHILWMAVCGMILTVWDSTRKKIWLGGEVLYLSKQAAARV
jgi:hypothetical protein